MINSYLLSLSLILSAAWLSTALEQQTYQLLTARLLVTQLRLTYLKNGITNYLRAYAAHHGQLPPQLTYPVLAEEILIQLSEEETYWRIVFEWQGSSYELSISKRPDSSCQGAQK